MECKHNTADGCKAYPHRTECIGKVCGRVMTDNEIIKALECCTSEDFTCNGCPYIAVDMSGAEYDCSYYAKKDALDLIKRQQAEIERLKAERDNLHECYLQICEDLKHKLKWNVKARAKAIKEFADKLKSKTMKMMQYDEGGWGCEVYIVRTSDIDNLAKEMGCGNA